MKRIIGLTLAMLAAGGALLLAPAIAQAAAVQPANSAAYNSGKEIGKYAGPVALALLALYGLWKKLGGGDDTLARPGGRRPVPPGSYPAPGSPALRGGQNAFASNPALLRLSASQWLAANSWIIIVASCFGLLGVVFLFIKLPVAIVFLASGAVWTIRLVRQAGRKFFMGDVCPGVVLYANLNLVAVFTDLKAAGNSARPAIKILKQPLQRVTTEPVADGMRVAAAALYYGNVRQAAWQDFSPEVIQCVVQDPVEIARVMGSIPDEQWQALDGFLAQVPEAKPGLYRMWDPNSAADAPLNAFDYSPPKPWFKTPLAIVTFAIFGGLVALTIALQVLGTMFHSGSRMGSPGSTPMPPPPPPAMRGGVPAPQPPVPGAMPPQPTQAGPFAVDAKVEANWAGGWKLGKVTSINPGGFTLMVQLEDPHFPFPIGLPTNQIRLR